MITGLRVFPLLLVLGLSHVAQAQQAYPTADAAAAALVAALGSDKADAERLAALLGSDWQSYIPTDDLEREDVDAFLGLYREKHVIESAAPERATLVVGNTPWSFPLPLVKAKDGWVFDVQAGGEEVRVRRIGRNELATVQAALAYHDAQMDYAEVDRDDDGVLEYAQQFVSSDGLYDGLYWVEEPGIEESPLGPLFGDDLPDGEWHGYHYRILTAQGPSAPGGAYDYKLGDNMSRGFALIAWPARYADSGVMSFMISHDGQVFEKDLGADGAKLATAMSLFDPDSSWQEVADDAENETLATP
ncbi:DUF2950 domain-containing protein [Aquipseudomonas guryensis]|jgi:hypothetical protein|uniref:DUF2950 domain-containing protein n=1 Tax=Aquipseudomonas guryensis TaxID=2759165 RepID=A0A7W4DB74_9GAMM|nr:DUF2950 domain-containing protein [Pseudomonas guryensis]MBB1519394.1 DUF2950 domain-containing protein [Pseudomonas guryensis]